MSSRLAGSREVRRPSREAGNAEVLARMLGLVAQQLAACGQLVSAHPGDELDPPACLAEGPGLVEGQRVHGHHLGSAAQRNAVPAQQAGDFEITRGGEQADEHQGGG